MVNRNAFLIGPRRAPAAAVKPASGSDPTLSSVPAWRRQCRLVTDDAVYRELQSYFRPHAQLQILTIQAPSVEHELVANCMVSCSACFLQDADKVPMIIAWDPVACHDCLVPFACSRTILITIISKDDCHATKDPGKTPKPAEDKLFEGSRPAHLDLSGERRPSNYMHQRSTHAGSVT